MSETPQDDPWARVRALRPNPYSHEHYYVASEADAARAAEATQHQQELIDLRANYAQSMRLSNDTLADTLARLAAVEAERDRLKAALEQAREWMRVASRTLRASGGRPSRDVALTTADQIDAALSGEGTKP